MTAVPSRFFSIENAPGYLHNTILYERKAVTDTWNKLTSVARRQWKWLNVPTKGDRQWIRTNKRILQVHGPPGTGKSSAVFFWVEKTCDTANTQALWLECATIQGECWKVEKNTLNERIETKKQAVPLSVEEVDHASIVVFDGIRVATLETWRALINQLARSGLFVIVVSSEGVRFHAGDSQDIMKLYHFVPSWLENEYLEACKNNDFWASVRNLIENVNENDTQACREEAIRQKFSIAGHSARFMFIQTASDVEVELERNVREMGNITTLDMAVRNDRSSGAVNSLIARLHEGKNGPTPAQNATFPSEEERNEVATTKEDLLQCQEDLDERGGYPRLVSDKATDEILKIIPGPVKTLHSIGVELRNQAIVGYALEEHLKTKLKEAQISNGKLELFEENGGLLHLPVSKFFEIRPNENSTHELNNLLRSKAAYKPNTWIFIGGRQGAFDAIHLVAHDRIRFVQVTAGQKHSFKLNLVDSLMRSLSTGQVDPVTWSHMEFMIIRPFDDTRLFTLETTVGGLSGNYLHFNDQRWDARDYRSNVTYARLRWDFF